MTLPASFLDELKSRVSLIDVVSSRVKLTRKGREYSGLCPFHNEKSPSFTVNEDKGFFHCFGCGAHGDALGFEMRANSLAFMDAVDSLAAKAGMEVPRMEPVDREREQVRAGILDVLEAAAKWYEAQLQTPPAQAARDYLVGRNVLEDTIARFRLGFAPDQFDALRRALGAAGYAESLMLDAGLIRRLEDGRLVDLLRNRVVFAITDKAGRVIGFGGRVLGDGKPKYINSPSTSVFDKGANLYGLAHSRQGAAQGGRLVVVEGYMDVIALHQAGMDYVVAPLGTALTERQLEQAWKLSPELVVCLDGDAAGQRAQTRVIERALPQISHCRRVTFCAMPDGIDPDELVAAEGAGAITQIWDGARPLIDLLWQREFDLCNPINSERMAALERSVLAKASAIADATTRRQWLGDLMTRMDSIRKWTKPEILRGRSVKNFAPMPASTGVAVWWERARAHTELANVRLWLEKHGLPWDVLTQKVGGIGFTHGRIVKGAWVSGAWSDTPKPTLWEPEGQVPLVIIPVLGDVPDYPVDLIGWNPHTGDIGSFTGTTVVLGEDVVIEAAAFEAAGLKHPVFCASSPLSWLRKKCADVPAVLPVDWGRLWFCLGGLSTLVGESLAVAEALDKAVKPPKIPAPLIAVAQSAAKAA